VGQSTGAAAATLRATVMPVEAGQDQEDGPFSLSPQGSSTT